MHIQSHVQITVQLKQVNVDANDENGEVRTRSTLQIDELSIKSDIKVALNSNLGQIPVHTKVKSDLYVIKSDPDLKMSDLMRFVLVHTAIKWPGGSV